VCGAVCEWCCGVEATIVWVVVHEGHYQGR